MIRFNENNEILTREDHRAILVGVGAGEEFELSMDELEGLAEADGVEVAGRIEQALERPVAATYIGSGKLAELTELCGSMEIVGSSSVSTKNVNPSDCLNCWSVMSLSRTLAVTVQTPEPSKVWRMFVLDGEPFYDETLTYVKRLQAAGVRADAAVYHGNVHGFDALFWTEKSRAAREKLCEFWEETIEGK